MGTKHEKQKRENTNPRVEDKGSKDGRYPQLCLKCLSGLIVNLFG